MSSGIERRGGMRTAIDAYVFRKRAIGDDRGQKADVRRDMHRVQVTSERRLSVTLRCAASVDTAAGSTLPSRSERRTARAHARTAQLTA